MTRSYLLIFILAGFSIITMGLQCGKEIIYSPQIPPVYQYTEKLTLTPFKKVYAINDTIQIQFQTTNKTLYDKLSSTRLPTDTTFLNVNFELTRQNPVEFTVENYAEVTVQNGLDTSFAPNIAPTDILTFHTACNNEPYFFKVSFVLKKTGVYSIDPVAMVAPCPDKIVNLPSSMLFTFDLPDCNYDIWQAIAGQSVNGRDSYIDVGIARKEVFAFKVE